MNGQVFTTERRVRFADCDAAGIVFFPRYFEMLNGVVEDWFAGPLQTSFRELHVDRQVSVPTAAASGRIHGNRCHENLLGGMAVRFAATRLAFDNNVLEKNLGPGLALEQGLDSAAFASNQATGNEGGKNTVLNADFSSGE